MMPLNLKSYGLYSDFGVGYLGYILGRGTIFSLCFKVQVGFCVPTPLLSNEEIWCML